MNESHIIKTNKRAIFIDRDGTLNEEVGYIRGLEQFRLYDYATEAVRLIKQAGWLAIIITNQSGIARGLFTEEFLAEVHQRMIAELERAATGVDAIYYCPHHPELADPSNLDDPANLEETPFRVDCDCRKPKPGMLERAAAEFGLTLSDCVVIGDRFRDVETAQAVGARGVLVLTGYGREELQTPSAVRPDHIAANLLEAVRWVINES